MKPYHGEIQKLNEEECKKLLQVQHAGHLGCHVKDDLYVVPITYVYEDGFIYSHSKLGKKIEMMRKNPKVCVQAEKVEDFFNWKSVIAWGEYQELKHGEDLAAMRWMIRVLAMEDRFKHIPSLELDLEAAFKSAIIYKIKVQKISGCYEHKS